MIIVSQDKTKAINFKRLNYIQVSKVDENKSIIEINHSNCNYLIIAEYKTEGRAKEVLQEIVKTYVLTEQYKVEDERTRIKLMMEGILLYEMPKE